MHEDFYGDIRKYLMWYNLVTYFTLFVTSVAIFQMQIWIDPVPFTTDMYKTCHGYISHFTSRVSGDRCKRWV